MNLLLEVEVEGIAECADDDVCADSGLDGDVSHGVGHDFVFWVVGGGFAYLGFGGGYNFGAC